MKLELKKRLIINNFEHFLQLYEDAEDFIKNHLNVDELGIDEESNARLLISRYFEQKQGLFIVLSNEGSSQIMVMQIKTPHYIVHGSYDNLQMSFGKKEDIEQFYLNYCRTNFDSKVDSYTEAKEVINQNLNEGSIIQIFKPNI